jgi:hypothetical protein
METREVRFETNKVEEVSEFELRNEEKERVRYDGKTRNKTRAVEKERKRKTKGERESQGSHRMESRNFNRSK